MKNIYTITEIEEKIKTLIENFNIDTFFENFLNLYDIPKTSISRAKLNKDLFFIKNKVVIKITEDLDNNNLQNFEEVLKNDKKNPRFIIMTNYKRFFSKDTKSNEILDIPFDKLALHAEFFLPWNGIEKVEYDKENPADLKAAERFTKLYDELIKINPDIKKSIEKEKYFNLFLVRSLFLFFAEDTGIIKESLFTNTLINRTSIDGRDLNNVISRIFTILDIHKMQRPNDTPKWLFEFPYVNGNLFSDKHHDIIFDKKTRKLLIEAGELLRWNEINPDILGSMIQNVANKEQRQVTGMHYTSVSNILKLIKPLFLNQLEDEYNRLYDKFIEQKNNLRKDKLNEILYDANRLIERLSKIKILDPACGSGNFLIIVYKEIRRIETNLLLLIKQINENNKGKQEFQLSYNNSSKIRLSNFYGIEIDEFAHEVAILSLYIAEHQMNKEMMEKIPEYIPELLPLQPSGKIINANALTEDWEKLIEEKENEEIYIIGNPPYIGPTGKNPQTKKQKADLLKAIYPLETKNVDYIFGWFYKASKFIKYRNAKYAFVSTNSLFQGQQAKYVLDSVLNDLEIIFAYPSFKWKNSAKNNAGVMVVIVGIAKKSKMEKKIYEKGEVKIVEKINCYLKQGDDFIVNNVSKPSVELPFVMMKGSSELGDNNLIFSPSQRDNIIKKYPLTRTYFKKIINATNYMNNTYSYALWIEEENINEVLKIPELKERLERVKEYRENSKRSGTKKYSNKPWEFVENRYKEKQAIILPVVNAEGRTYLPVSYLEKGVISTNANYLIYDGPIWLVAILSSRMHMLWLMLISGKLKNDYRYSARMVYNTFPLKKISNSRKKALENAVLNLFDVREEEGGTLAELYGGANKDMNEQVKLAHKKIDGIVERIYKLQPIESDEERIGILKKLYLEQNRGDDYE